MVSIFLFDLQLLKFEFLDFLVTGLFRLLTVLPVWFKLLYCFYKLLLGSSEIFSKCAWLPVVLGIRFLCGMKPIIDPEFCPPSKFSVMF